MPQLAHARRHATRTAFVGNELVAVYHAAPSRKPVDLLGPRPAGLSGKVHRADRCTCPVLSTESPGVWNASCPTDGEPRPWRVTYR
jgi:hypothetical protein